MNLMTLDDLSLHGKRVLVRVDFNVPVTREGEVADDLRIDAALPGIREVLAEEAALVLMSHLGRPGGRRDDALSLGPVARRLSEKLDRPVQMAPDCVGEETGRMAHGLRPGQLLLLENLRFHPGEKDNDAAFARTLASHADVYVNDAFATSHRAHASVAGVPAVLRPAAAGRLLEQEIEQLGFAAEAPARPYVAIIGGAKVAGKIGPLAELLRTVDALLVGGAMAYPLLKFLGHGVGASLAGDEHATQVARLFEADEAARKIVLPIDHVVAGDRAAATHAETTDGPDIGAGWQGGDIGPRTLALFRARVAEAKTVFWNGPLGIFETPVFANGTLEMARFLAARTEAGTRTIAGGGDTAAAVDEAGVRQCYSHVSTGGGAALEFVAGRRLPGIEALDERRAGT